MKQQEKIPSRIRAAGKDLPYGVPDSYFENLPQRIQARLPESKTVPFNYRVRTIRLKLAIAAMFIGLLAVGYMGYRMISSQNTGPLQTGNEFMETMEYLGYELNDDILISAIMESEIELTPFYGDVETDEIIEYLSEEEIDFVQLMNNF